MSESCKSCSEERPPTKGEIRLCRELDELFKQTQPLTIYRLRRLFLLFTQAHFSRSDHYGDLQDNLCDLTFDPDNPESGSLQVELTDAYDLTADSLHKPGIYVRFNGFVLDSQVINNSVGMQGETWDRERFTQKATGELTIIALHKSLDIASQLAETAYDMFTGARMHIKKALGLSLFHGTSIMKAEDKGAKPLKHFQVETKFKVEFQLNVDQIFEGHLLKKIGIYANMS